MNPLRRITGGLLRIYGIVLTRNRTTRTYGYFRILNRRNVRVGNNCSFNAGVFIQGYHDVEIEDQVTLSPGCMLLDSGLDVGSLCGNGVKEHIRSFIVIRRGAWIGAGAIVLPGVTVGQYAVVGAGSVVTKDVEPYTVVAGNPIRVIRRVSRGGQCREDARDSSG